MKKQGYSPIIMDEKLSLKRIIWENQGIFLKTSMPSLAVTGRSMTSK